MGIIGLHSLMGSNKRLLDKHFNMHEELVLAQWNERCKCEPEILRKSVQICDVCDMRDSCTVTFLIKNDCDILIEFLCTS